MPTLFQNVDVGWVPNLVTVRDRHDVLLFRCKLLQCDEQMVALCVFCRPAKLIRVRFECFVVDLVSPLVEPVDVQTMRFGLTHKCCRRFDDDDLVDHITDLVQSAFEHVVFLVEQDAVEDSH